MNKTIESNITKLRGHIKVIYDINLNAYVSDPNIKFRINSLFKQDNNSIKNFVYSGVIVERMLGDKKYQSDLIFTSLRKKNNSNLDYTDSSIKYITYSNCYMLYDSN